VRRFSAINVAPHELDLDALAKEQKRLRTRFKIINEIVKTEETFLQDMATLEDCYHGRCMECAILTRRDEQTIFGRTKNVVSFTDTFYKELYNAAGQWKSVSEDQVASAPLDELAGWDSETWIGEAFWSSVYLRIHH
jgi:hypothetical protein